MLPEEQPLPLLDPHSPERQGSSALDQRSIKFRAFYPEEGRSVSFDLPLPDFLHELRADAWLVSQLRYSFAEQVSQILGASVSGLDENTLLIKPSELEGRFDEIRQHGGISSARLYEPPNSAGLWETVAGSTLYDHRREYGALQSLSGTLRQALFEGEPARWGMELLSLGPGTGDKDIDILRKLSQDMGIMNVKHLLVDSSLSMLSRAAHKILTTDKSCVPFSLRLELINCHFEHLSKVGLVKDNPQAIRLVTLLGYTVGNLDQQQIFFEILPAVTTPGDLLLIDMRFYGRGPRTKKQKRVMITPYQTDIYDAFSVEPVKYLLQSAGRKRDDRNIISKRDVVARFARVDARITEGESIGNLYQVVITLRTDARQKMQDVLKASLPDPLKLVYSLRYNQDSFRGLLDKAGFDIVETSQVGGSRSVSGGYQLVLARRR